LSEAIAKLAIITFSHLSLLSKNDKPWFLNRGKNLAAIFITPSSWVSQWDGHLPRIKLFFWRRCRGGSRRLLRGEFFAHTSFTLLLFCFTLIILPASFFIKNPKKLVPTIVVIFVGLLLSCFIMLSINGWFL
jgi:hypothetical protein